MASEYLVLACTLTLTRNCNLVRWGVGRPGTRRSCSDRRVAGRCAQAVASMGLRVKGDAVAELVECGDDPLRGAFRIALREVGAADFVVGLVIREHVPDRGDDGVLDGNQGLHRASAGGQSLGAVRVPISKSQARIPWAWPGRNAAQVWRSFGCGLDPVRSQDLPHGRGRDPDTQHGELVVDYSVAPSAILAGQEQNEGLDRAARRWPAGCLRREASAWRRRMKSRCHRKIVSGMTIRCNCRNWARGNRWRSVSRKARSTGVSRGLSICYCRIVSWWRSVKSQYPCPRHSLPADG